MSVCVCVRVCTCVCVCVCEVAYPRSSHSEGDIHCNTTTSDTNINGDTSSRQRICVELTIALVHGRCHLCEVGEGGGGCVLGVGWSARM